MAEAVLISRYTSFGQIDFMLFQQPSSAAIAYLMAKVDGVEFAWSFNPNEESEEMARCKFEACLNSPKWIELCLREKRHGH